MTPTIYTAKHLSGGSSSTALFSLKGLDNLAPSQISTLVLEGIPLQKQIAYTEYAANISCFLYATQTRRTINITGQPLGLVDVNSSLPIKCPVISFTLKKPLDSDNSRKLLAVLGPGASSNVSGKTTIYNAPALPKDMLEGVINLAPPHFNPGRDSVNPAGAFAHSIISAICWYFLRTHSYPAFSDENTQSLLEMHSLLAGDTIYFQRTKKDKDGQDVDAFDPKEFSRLLAVPQDTDQMDADVDEDSMRVKLSKATGRFKTGGTDVVTKAKPCPVIQTNIGTRRDVPNLPGIAFPYFHGLIQPDGGFMNTIILRRFFQLLGSSIQKCQDAYLILRRGCNSLGTTKEGMALTHLLKGIDLALNTQTRCFMLFDAGEYHGFILLGARFGIFDNTSWCVPGSEEELASAIAELDPHESAVRALVDKFGLLSQADIYKGPSVSAATFSDPDNLIEVFRGMKLSELDKEDEKQIDRHLRNLNYMGDGYLARNPQMIAEVLESLATGTQIKLVRPTYIPSIRIDIGGRVFSALSKFGPEAISFWNDRGVEIRCEAKEKVNVALRKRKVGEMDLFANMPEKILISPKPLSIAVRDLEQVLKRGCIKIDLNERAGRFRNMSVESEDMRKRIWRALVSIVESPDNAKRQRTEIPESDELDFDSIFNKLVSQ